MRWAGVVAGSVQRCTCVPRDTASRSSSPSQVVESLMEDGAVRRAGLGRPRIRPQRLAGDKGYSTNKVRGYLRRHGIGVVIPYQADQRASASFDRRAYRERNRIERLINRLKQFRRIATRYEKRAANYLAMLTVAAIILWL